MNDLIRKTIGATLGAVVLTGAVVWLSGGCGERTQVEDGRHQDLQNEEHGEDRGVQVDPQHPERGDDTRGGAFQHPGAGCGLCDHFLPDLNR